MTSGGPRALDLTALRRLLERDHGIADFLARAIARDADPQNAVLDAWHLVISDAARAGAPAPGREQLLGAVVVAVHDAGLLDADTGSEPPRLGRLNPAGDRWEGWWDDEDHPAAWPDDVAFDRTQLLRAVRRLPLRLRFLVVMREAAGLDPDAVARVLGGTPASLAPELDLARLSFIKSIGDDVPADGL